MLKPKVTFGYQFKEFPSYHSQLSFIFMNSERHGIVKYQFNWRSVSGFNKSLKCFFLYNNAQSKPFLKRFHRRTSNGKKNSSITTLWLVKEIWYQYEWRHHHYTRHDWRHYVVTPCCQHHHHQHAECQP